MDPVNKALWFVESHFAQDVDLDDIAAIAGVSRYHLTRAFGVATGQPLMRYMRGRRLSVAARSLANGASDILSVALEAGYGSHEAFTRAFREQFGLTPEAARAQRNLENLHLVEAIKMDENLNVKLDPPRVVDGKPLLIAGLNARYGAESGANIPAQWQRFTPRLGNIPGQVGGTAYGVIYNHDDDGNYDYLCGVEVSAFSKLPPDMDRVRVPEQRYAVFTHPGHISGIRSTWNTIWNRLLPESGLELVDAPAFERYGEEFDGASGEGGLECWVPIKRQDE
jgi:AraC family transcriptional regulator